ncbi:MAG: vitamin K epoxide reductase family protein [Candidatus Paceibacterota bacterium]
MQFTHEIFIRTIIFILALAGFFVARHIRRHKTENKPLVCIVGFDCHAVVHSDYSKFFGIPVELLGMFYYGLVALVSFLFIFMGNLLPHTMTVFLSLASFLASLFSIYLISIQLFVLKKGCSWCFVSALISIMIFLVVVFNYDFSFISQIF